MNLIPKAKTPDAKAYYIKLKGDYYRYRAEKSMKLLQVSASIWNHDNPTKPLCDLLSGHVGEPPPSITKPAPYNRH